MKALTFHGKRDVRVDEVPDPSIQDPTDAIVRITSTAICGSDLHLYEVLGMFIDEGDILGHEPMGIVEEVGPEVTQIKAGDRVVIPFNISCGALLDVRAQVLRPVRDDAEPRAPKRAPRCSATPSSTARCRAARPSSCGCRRPTSARSRCPRAAPTSATCSSPTCCRPPGRRSTTRRSRKAAASPSSASGRSAR